MLNLEVRGYGSETTKTHVKQQQKLENGKE